MTNQKAALAMSGLKHLTLHVLVLSHQGLDVLSGPLQLGFQLGSVARGKLVLGRVHCQQRISAGCLQLPELFQLKSSIKVDKPSIMRKLNNLTPHLILQPFDDGIALSSLSVKVDLFSLGCLDQLIVLLLHQRQGLLGFL